MILNYFPTLQGLSSDSRSTKPGDLFFAIPGVMLDGNRFISEAVKKGAVGVVCQRGSQIPPVRVPLLEVENVRKVLGEAAAEFYGHPSRRLKVIAITGTNGKTSICYLTAQALNVLGKKTAMMSTLGNGFPGELEASELTTVDALSIQASFAAFLKAGAEYVVMEASSHGLDQERLAGTEIRMGVFTNLTRDHLDYHPTLEAYAEAKSRLFTKFKLEAAVINTDDAHGREFARLSENVLTYGMEESADIQASKIALGFSGMAGELQTPVGTVHFQSQLVGKFNVYNLMAIVGILMKLTFPLSRIVEVLEKLPQVPGRANSLTLKNGAKIFVDFAHTPDALEKILTTLRSFLQGKLICVFGCGGDRDRGKRPMMAKISESLADISIITDDNPRFENSLEIISEILAGFSEHAVVHVEPNRSRAIQIAVEIAGENDIILLAGKGAEPYQVVGDQKIPFNELEVLAPYVQTVV